MKKLLALAVLSTVSFAAPCFGVDFVRDRIYTSMSYSAGNAGYAIGYHHTDSVKISAQSMLSVKDLAKDVVQQKVQGSVLVNLHYHHELRNTDITPYISAGVGSNISKGVNGLEYGFSYKISSGFNLPLSSTTNVFAGYSLLKEFGGHNHGLEFGVKFNL